MKHFQNNVEANTMIINQQTLTMRFKPILFLCQHS